MVNIAKNMLINEENIQVLHLVFTFAFSSNKKRGSPITDRLDHNRASESLVFNSGQKMALRAFYFITKALRYYYINRFQRHIFAAIANN